MARYSLVPCSLAHSLPGLTVHSILYAKAIRRVAARTVSPGGRMGRRSPELDRQPGDALEVVVARRQGEAELAGEGGEPDVVVLNRLAFRLQLSADRAKHLCGFQVGR